MSKSALLAHLGASQQRNFNARTLEAGAAKCRVQGSVAKGESSTHHQASFPVQRLAKEHRKQAGISDTPTTGMYGECQELLQMFGLPYIIAPVEAEAQCAWLDNHGLVDGVVTDDNDVFLFGGQHVYRSNPTPSLPPHPHSESRKGQRCRRGCIEREARGALLQAHLC